LLKSKKRAAPSPAAPPVPKNPLHITDAIALRHAFCGARQQLTIIKKSQAQQLLGREGWQFPFTP
jgi:hypothetical protein